jgi:hypothetical protein
MSEWSEIPLRVAAERKLAEEWALVLVAEGLSPSVRHSSEGYLLGVPAEEAERAVAILSSYERENPVETHEGDEAAGYAHVVTALAVAGALVVF